MMMLNGRWSWIAALSAALAAGCSTTLYLNPPFVNQLTGSVVPLTPGDRSEFVLVRAQNTTSGDEAAPIEFVITAERLEPDPDNPDAMMATTQTFRVLTQPESRANDLGVLFNCPVSRIGLGETLDRPTTEPGLFLNATAVGAGGVGVPPNVNPLSSEAGNFDCGDTIVFVASRVNSVAGGVAVTSFVLDDESQPTEVERLDTFVNARTLIEQEQVEEE